MTAATIADLIRQGRRNTLAGRNAELRLLSQVTAPGGPVVAYLHGPAGIGKTALISALDACLEDEGVRRLHIAAGAVEPTPTAILTALGRVIDRDTRTIAELAAALGSAKDVTVVMVDDVDTWRLAASWLRADLLPALPASTRFVLAGNVPRRLPGRSGMGSTSSISSSARFRGRKAMRRSPPPVSRQKSRSVSGS